MKEIKIKFCDGMIMEEDLVFLPLLKKHYKVVISDNPDFLFYGSFGKEHLRYDCIKIFSTGECIAPDFNECDYATGFEYMTLQDRYLRLPLSHIMFRNGINMMDFALKKAGYDTEVPRNRFCSFVVSNGRGMEERRRIFELLEEYKTVDSGGRFLNNVGSPVEDKLQFDREHKFSICFENECYPGYTTEKLTEAFAAGCIPIYYGDPLVGKVFNEKAFIDCSRFDTLEAAVDFVKKVDNDEVLYHQMLQEPILLENTDCFRELEKFLCNIMDQEPEKARRRPRSQGAYNVEHEYYLTDLIHLKTERIKKKIRERSL